MLKKKPKRCSYLKMTVVCETGQAIPWAIGSSCAWQNLVIGFFCINNH
ncbi:Putative membrane lipoprotein [Arabidopsis thaliana]|uniref:Membrane lipoprotein n=1 Tax=Arabidopsis thaliana TaxID=3702 RepID=B3H6V8_ARATH|nr:Putative membrane lipoprotein [Arabidopsis thaliana]AEE79015.1 Putative membrane lipoprotein [Arabidopsis thaliana]|eukprot:NP_001118827.1 Putative membrane lipoprotein [Arabidopsis thaliana]